jgi:hypothetical protein
VKHGQLVLSSTHLWEEGGPEGPIEAS